MVDPFMHPRILEIVNMISSYGITQRFDTNGGMKNRFLVRDWKLGSCDKFCD